MTLLILKCSVRNYTIVMFLLNAIAKRKINERDTKISA